MPPHQYVPVHGMQWVWLVMVAPLVVSYVDGYRCVKRGEEMMGTCAEQTVRNSGCVDGYYNLLHLE